VKSQPSVPYGANFCIIPFCSMFIDKYFSLSSFSQLLEHDILLVDVALPVNGRYCYKSVVYFDSAGLQVKERLKKMNLLVNVCSSPLNHMLNKCKLDIRKFAKFALFLKCLFSKASLYRMKS